MPRLPRSLLLTLALLLAHAMLPSCVATYEPGTAVTLSLRAVLDGAVDALGRTVDIERASLHVAHVELLPCEPRATVERSLRSVARAHHGSADGSSLRAKHFVPLHEGPYLLGVLSPVPGRYCALRITVEPAGSDSEGVGEDGADEGLTVVAEGTWQHLDERGAMRAEAPGNAVFDVELDRALEVTADAPEAALAVSVDLAALFATTDATADPFDVGLDLVAHLDEHTSCAVTAP